MARRLGMLVMIGLYIVLLNSSASGAWHAPDETENSQFGAVAGDPAVVQHAEECIDETQQEDDWDCTVLYAHIIQWPRREMPLTPQPPADCFPDQAPFPRLGFGSFPVLEFYSGHSFVRYEPAENGGPCDTPFPSWNRGFGDVVNFSEDYGIHAYWYLSSDALYEEMLVGDLMEAGFMPCVTLAVTIEALDRSGAETTIASGELTKTMVSMTEGANQMVFQSDPCPPAEGEVSVEEATEFHVVLDTTDYSIDPAYESMRARVEWYLHRQTSRSFEENNITEPFWVQRTGHDYPNRIVVPLENPLKIHTLQLLDDAGEPVTRLSNESDVSIELVVQSPLGRHDVDVKNIRFQLFDEDGTLIHLKHLGEGRESDESVEGAHWPWGLLYAWDLAAEDLPDGDYTMRASAANWQHTSQAEQEITFTVEPPEKDEEFASGLPSLVLVGLTFVLVAGTQWKRFTRTS